MLVEILIFLVTSLIAYFIYLNKKVHQHFDEHGVKYVPGWPLFGNLTQSSLMKTHFVEDLDAVYRAFPDERYVGVSLHTEPVILVRDPELMKMITVKDFDHFTDHKHFFPDFVETIMNDSILFMNGDRWRDMRTTLSPAFTGSKMRLMMPFMVDICKNIVKYLKENKENIDVDDIVRRYTNDVIASAGFGIQINSIENKENEFYRFGQTFVKFTFKQRMILFFAVLLPGLAKRCHLKLNGDEDVQFFRNIVASTMEFRKKNNVERPDMIQLLMEASKGTLESKSNISEKDDVGFATVQESFKPKPSGKTRDWSFDELTAQVIIFFSAGYETTASTLALTIHELALDTEVQEKLYEEVKAFKETEVNLTYDNINKLKYLDCVINETLRKWSPALIMDRTCTKAYELPPPREGGKPYYLKPGDVVFNVVNSAHMDPKYYPNPDKYIPERFTEENRHNIKPFTFMPFGMGPRACIGSRFALLEIKVFMYHLMLNLKIVKCAKTMDPIKIAPQDIVIMALGGSWAKFESRS